MANYSADAHIVQMRLLKQLLLTPSCKFAVLTSASGLSSDHANFHIKQLIAAGFVRHVAKSYGEYELTRAGKEYANRMDIDAYEIERQPKLTVDLAIEDVEGRFIVQTRKKHPYYGYSGFPTGKIRWGETMVEAGARELLEETGLSADLRVVGVYHKLDYDTNGELLEDKYMCLIHGTNPRGELIAETESHVNAWMTPDEYKSLDNRMGNIDTTIAQLRNDAVFVREDAITFPDDAY